MFEPNAICDMMSIVVNGIVEMHIEYDQEKIVLERCGRGTIINQFNFIVEEEMYVTASMASPQTVIY